MLQVLVGRVPRGPRATAVPHRRGHGDGRRPGHGGRPLLLLLHQPLLEQHLGLRQIGLGHPARSSSSAAAAGTPGRRRPCCSSGGEVGKVLRDADALRDADDGPLPQSQQVHLRRRRGGVLGGGGGALIDVTLQRAVLLPDV